MEFLKEVLGEELYTSVKEKVDAYNADDNRKDNPLKIGDLSTGRYVSKDKFSALETEANGYKTQLETLNAELTALKDKKGTDGDTKEALKALQEQHSAEMQSLKERLESTRRDGLLESALIKGGARNTKAVKALLDMERIKMEDDKLDGLDDQLDALRKDSGYLFNDTGAWGSRLSGAPSAAEGVEAAFAKLNPDLKID